MSRKILIALLCFLVGIIHCYITSERVMYGKNGLILKTKYSYGGNLTTTVIIKGRKIKPNVLYSWSNPVLGHVIYADKNKQPVEIIEFNYNDCRFAENVEKCTKVTKISLKDYLKSAYVKTGE